jgi:hypothetical protein
MTVCVITCLNRSLWTDLVFYGDDFVGFTVAHQQVVNPEAIVSGDRVAAARIPTPDARRYGEFGLRLSGHAQRTMDRVESASHCDRADDAGSWPSCFIALNFFCHSNLFDWPRAGTTT